MNRGIILTCTLLFAGSCNTLRTDDPGQIEAGLLAYVPENDRAQIQESRNRRAQATEDLRIAESGVEQVKARRELADHDLDVVRKRVKEAEDSTDYVRKYGNAQELEAARRRREESNIALRFANAKIHYYEDLGSLADELVALHEARVELAEATVKLEEARAVSQLDRPAAQEIDVQIYEGRVYELQDRVSMKTVDARTARVQVGLRQEFLDERARAVPASFRLNAIDAPETILALPDFENGQWDSNNEPNRRGR